MFDVETSVKNGWNVFHLPLGQKFPPPAGFTGSKVEITKEMQDEQIASMRFINGNYGIRMSHNVVGIDLDDQTTPEGQVVKEESANAIRITSSDGKSRFTALYRLPDGMDPRYLRNVPGVDVITKFHRYSVLGVHPSGRPYKLLNELDEEMYALPPISALQPLPDAIRRVMRRESKPKASEAVTVSQKAVSVGSGFTPSDKAPCARALYTAKVGLNNVKTGASAHNSALMAQQALSNENMKGHNLGSLPLVILEAFVERAGEDRREEGIRMMERLRYQDSECACSSEKFNESLNVPQEMLDKAGVDYEDLVSMVWIRVEENIREKGITFPTAPHRVRYEQTVAMSILTDIIRKHKNQAKLKTENYIRETATPDTSFEVTKLKSLIDSISDDSREKKVLFLMAYGDKLTDIANEVGISRVTLNKIRKSIRSKARENLSQSE